VPESLTGSYGLGIKAERGWSLTVARARQPLVFGERPLDEVLAERDTDDLRQLIERPPRADQSLVDLSASGVAAIARWIIQGLSKTADTEVSTIFFDSAADPITLFLDVGIPIPAEMFTAADPRLSVGDRVRQITFVGVSPVDARVGELGFRFRYERFARYLRETTIIKATGNQVLVSLRHVLLKGRELVPLKLRPELRLLGILKLGHTFFEQRFTRGGTASSVQVYRIDLSHPEGRNALEALLGEGTDVRYRPLRVAAERGQGAELLGQERRRGDRRLHKLRMDLFSFLRFDDRKTIFSERVKAGNLEFEETGVARLRNLRTRIGRNRDWKKKFLVSAQGNRRIEGKEANGPPREAAFAVNLLTEFRSVQADTAEVRRQVALLEHALGHHPIFDLLTALDDTKHDDFFASLSISLGAEHLAYFESVSEQRIWEEMAEMLLGVAHTNAWATPQARQGWIRRGRRRAYETTIGKDLTSRPQPFRKRWGLKYRYRLARRVVKEFAQVQELIRTGICLPCLSAAFDKQKDFALLQVLFYRLASDPGMAEPGYHLEIFGGPMLSPVTLSNGVRYAFDTAGLRVAEILGETAPSDDETGTEETLRRISDSLSVWGGAKNLVDEAKSRLRAGEVYYDVAPLPPTSVARATCEAPRWKLRLWSDLRFSPELALRIDLRDSRAFRADLVRETFLLPLSEPAGISETPFATARFYYDVTLPPIEGLEGDASYTLLLRILNPDGQPVSEEQQLRFRWPTAEELITLRDDADLASAGPLAI